MVKLRKGVILQVGDTTVLHDTETGFSIELATQAINDSLENQRIAIRLNELGFTDNDLNPAQIRQRQRNALHDAHGPTISRLRARLSEIIETVPYFQHKANAYAPTRIETENDFGRLPFMRKCDLRNNFPGGLVPNTVPISAGLLDGSLSVVSTSGSTDERIQIISKSRIDRLPFGVDDLFGVHIGGAQPRTAFFAPPGCSTVGCRLSDQSYDSRLSTGGSDLFLQSATQPFFMNEPIVNSIIEDISRFSPTILEANPVHLQCLIWRSRQLRLTLPSIPLILTAYQYAPQAVLRDIRRAFKCPLLNDYSASEENRLALECHRGGLHIRADRVFFEIFNSEGPCEPGVVGSIAITTFDSVTPLIRYLIGDLASWTGRRCDCAFANWPTIELHGRLKDMLYSRKRWVTTREIDTAIGDPEWLACYQIRQRSESLIEADLVPSPQHAVCESDFIDRISSCIDPATIVVRPRNSLMPSASMKFGLTVNDYCNERELP